MKHPIMAAVALLLGSAVHAGPSPVVYDAPTDVTFIDLGTLGGAESAATDINKRGVIVGWTLTGSGATAGFYYVDGVMEGLGVSEENTRMTGINNNDEVVGGDEVNPGVPRAIWGDLELGIYSGRGGSRPTTPRFSVAAISDSSLKIMQEWWPGDVLPARAHVWHYEDIYSDIGAVFSDINTAGLVVGTDTLDLRVMGSMFVWDVTAGGAVPRRCVPLPLLGCTNVYESNALGINNSGEVVGYWRSAPHSRAFYWDGHSEDAVDLYLLPTGTHSVADDINDGGFIAGYADQVSGEFKIGLDAGFLFHKDFGMYALPRPKFVSSVGHCRAKALNERNEKTGVIQVVGTCEAGEVSRAVLWEVHVPARKG